MHRSIVLLVVVLTLAACNQAEQEPTGQDPVARQPSRAQGAADARAPIPVAESERSLEGTLARLPAGGEVEIISVGTFDEQTNDLAGPIAVEGRVSEVYADRGTFLLVDFDRMKGCSTGCCPQAEIPLRLAMDKYDGEFPVVDDVVILVGELTVTETGYALNVAEVQRNGEPILFKTV